MANISKTSFGFSQLENETPEWANWIFRGYFIISKAMVGYLAGLTALKELNISILTLTVVMLTINLLLDPIMYGFSKLFGIVPDNADPKKPLLADKQIENNGTDVKDITPVIIKPTMPVSDRPIIEDTPVVIPAPQQDVSQFMVTPEQPVVTSPIQ